MRQVRVLMAEISVWVFLCWKLWQNFHFEVKLTLLLSRCHGSVGESISHTCECSMNFYENQKRIGKKKKKWHNISPWSFNWIKCDTFQEDSSIAPPQSILWSSKITASPSLPFQLLLTLKKSLEEFFGVSLRNSLTVSSSTPFWSRTKYNPLL